MRKRQNHIQCWLSDTELRKLNSNVKKTGLTREQYIRSLIMGTVPKELPSAEFSEVLTALRHIGNNMNQLALRANSGGSVPPEEYRQNCNDLQNAITDILREVRS